MILYDYFRSTACYRVRLAFSIKHLDYTPFEIHLIHHGGEQNSPQYRQINPQGLVPSLEINGQILTQSLAIIEYIEEIHPERPLLPKNPFEKATVRSLALLIACDIHPLNNLSVLNQLKQTFNASESQITTWYHHWLKAGFDAFEARLGAIPHQQAFCYGDHPSLADICLIPQVYNAKRFNFPMDAYPLINHINASCLQLDAFKKAAP